MPATGKKVHLTFPEQISVANVIKRHQKGIATGDVRVEDLKELVEAAINRSPSIHTIRKIAIELEMPFPHWLKTQRGHEQALERADRMRQKKEAEAATAYPRRARLSAGSEPELRRGVATHADTRDRPRSDNRNEDTYNWLNRLQLRAMLSCMRICMELHEDLISKDPNGVRALALNDYDKVRRNLQLTYDRNSKDRAAAVDKQYDLRRRPNGRDDDETPGLSEEPLMAGDRNESPAHPLAPSPYTNPTH